MTTKILAYLVSFSVFSIGILWFLNMYLNAAHPILHTLSEICRTLLAACFISGLFELFFRYEFSKTLKAELSEIINKSVADQTNALSRGLLNVYGSFREANADLNLSQKMRTAKEVLILQTWIPTIVDLTTSLQALIRNDGKLRVLCLRPGSDIAKNRGMFIELPKDLEDLQNPNYGAESLEFANQSIRSTTRPIERAVGSEYIRYYEAMPTCSLYVIDNVIVMGHFLLGVNSVLSMQIEVDRRSKYGQELIDYFDNMWNIASEME